MLLITINGTFNTLYLVFKSFILLEYNLAKGQWLQEKITINPLAFVKCVVETIWPSELRNEKSGTTIPISDRKPVTAKHWVKTRRTDMMDLTGFFMVIPR